LELLSRWLKKSNSLIPADIPATVVSWAIYSLASYFNHGTPARAGGTREQCPALEKFVDEALPLVKVNLEQIA